MGKWINKVMVGLLLLGSIFFGYSAVPGAAAPLGMPQQEQQMLELVNRERVDRGLSPLAMDNRLLHMARLKSRDMVDDAYFAHQSPRYGSPSSMFAAQGVQYQFMGENIAMAGTVEHAHQLLMESPGHRRNILSPNFHRLGIGIVQGPDGLMISQEFID